MPSVKPLSVQQIVGCVVYIYVCGRLSKDFVIAMDGRMHTLISSSMLVFLFYESIPFAKCTTTMFPLNRIFFFAQYTYDFFFLVSMHNNEWKKKKHFVWNISFANVNTNCLRVVSKERESEKEKLSRHTFDMEPCTYCSRWMCTNLTIVKTCIGFVGVGYSQAPVIWILEFNAKSFIKRICLHANR